MASLVMTIESSDEEQNDQGASTKTQHGRGGSKKTQRPSSKQAGPTEVAGDEDLVMAAREGGDPANALFLESSADDSDEPEFLRRADGGRATRWNFKQQLVVASGASRPTGQETDDTSDAQKPAFSMLDRVQKHLRLQ